MVCRELVVAGVAVLDNDRRGIIITYKMQQAVANVAVHQQEMRQEQDALSATYVTRRLEIHRSLPCLNETLERSDGSQWFRRDDAL